MSEGAFGRAIGWSLLTLLLVLYGVGGRYAPYAVLAATVIAVPYLIVARAGRRMIPDGLARGFLVALALLLVAFALSARQPADVLIITNFAWLLIAIPIGSLVKRLAWPNAGIFVGRLALGGVAAMFAFALYQRVGLDAERIGRLTSDPIRMANVGVVVGSLALVGIAADRGRARFIYVLGPLFAAGVAFLAGTRGAMFGEAVIAVICVLLLVERKLLALAVAVGLAVLGALALYVAAQLHIPRLDSLFATIREILSGQSVEDGSAQIRLAMVRTGWRAFLDSPLYGHGWQNLMPAVTRYLPPGQEHLFDTQPQLHSDLLNFAVGGGVLGLGAYATMLLTPVFAALTGVRDRLFRVRVFGAAVLTLSYGVLGVSSLMFGFEQPTALFAGLSAIVLGLCRERGPVALEHAQGVARMGPPGLVEIAVTSVLLIMVLCVVTFAGLLSPYVVIAIGVIVWLVLLLSGRLPESYTPFAGRWFFMAFVLLFVLFALTMRALSDLLFVFNFVMLLLAGPFLLLFTRASERIKPATVALLASAGVVLTLAMVGGLALTGNPRPGGLNLSQIVLSNATLALAVVAATGAIALKSRWSLLLPLMIVVAVAVTLLTQSRGPLIAVVPLLILTAQFLWRTRLRGNGWFVAVTLLVVLFLGAGALQFAGGRITHLPRLVASFFGGESMGDATTDIRLALYRAGWRAFLDAPLVGHGWARLMSAPTAYLDPSFLDDIKTLHQLHNDVLNFAVTGGVAGVAILVLILFTPLVAALRSPPDALRPARIYGTAGLAIVYVGGGLTDLMFGQEFHTMLFVMLNVIVLGLFREQRAPTLAKP